MKAVFCSLSLIATPLIAQTIFTTPQGYTKIRIPAATGVDQPTLSVFSATLLNEAQFSGSVTVQNDYNPDPDGDPATPFSSQTVTASNVEWETGAWTGEPHLAYLVNSNGSEEAFLITSNTPTSVTVDAPFDLFAESRFPASTSLKIRKANTVGSILGTTETPFSSSDRVYLWGGDSWVTLLTAGGNWFFFGGENSGESATGAVVFPEEGIFVQRVEQSEAVLTLIGEVPTVRQASTVAGPGAGEDSRSHFVSVRYPVGNPLFAEPAGIRLADLGIDQITGWNVQDRVYFWGGNNWQALLANGENWFFFGGDNSGSSANDLIIPPNSALFLSRSSSGSSESSELSPDLPYLIE